MGICDRCSEKSDTKGKQYGMFWICDTCEDPETMKPIDMEEWMKDADRVYKQSRPKTKCPNCGHKL